LLEKLSEDPELMKAVGPLPERCVLAAHVSRNYALAGKLLSRLEASGRPGAAELLAWHAFHGEDMPYDLDKARHWARVAAESSNRWGFFASVYIESVAGPTPEARAMASEALHRLAEDGHERAIDVIAYRHATGVAEPLDPEKALSYYRRLSYAKEATMAQMYENFGLKNFNPNPAVPQVADLDLSVDSPPRPLGARPSFYPRELAQARYTGEVTITAVVDEAGFPQNITITNSSHPLLTVSAEAAAKLWRFTPGHKNGKLIRVRVSQTVRFSP
jgi:TonB family protein